MLRRFVELHEGAAVSPEADDKRRDFVRHLVAAASEAASAALLAVDARAAQENARKVSPTQWKPEQPRAGTAAIQDVA